MDDLRQVLALHIRRLRQEKDWTQEDLAGHVGLSSRYIGQLERGRAAATVTVVGKLAEAFGVEPAEMIRRRK